MPNDQTSTPNRDQRPFTWPPRSTSAPVVVERTGQLHNHPGPAAIPLLVPRQSLWAAIEQAFLDLTAGPLADRALDANWQPDDFSDYCNRCGLSLRPQEAAASGCSSCRDVKLAWQRMVRLGPFNYPLREWVHEVKFTRWRRLGNDLGELLGQQLLSVQSTAQDSSLPPVLVPVPDSGLRRIVRGIDHAMVIARGINHITGWSIATPLARRFGPSQLSVAPSQRASNVSKSFVLRSRYSCSHLAGRSIILVDDVCTTGATLRTCARLIANACRTESKANLTTIWTAVLARTEPDHLA